MDYEEAARKKNLKMEYVTITAGMLVVSTFEEETVEWLTALPSQGKIHDASHLVNHRNPSEHARGDYRTAVYRDDRNFDVQIIGGNFKFIDLLTPFYLDEARGIIVLVDHQRPASFEASREILTFLRSYELKLVIAAVDIAPEPQPELMRQELQLLDNELYFTCDLKDRRSVKESMMTVVRLIPEFANNKSLMEDLSVL